MSSQTRFENSPEVYKRGCASILHPQSAFVSWCANNGVSLPFVRWCSCAVRPGHCRHSDFGFSTGRTVCSWRRQREEPHVQSPREDADPFAPGRLVEAVGEVGWGRLSRQWADLSGGCLGLSRHCGPAVPNWAGLVPHHSPNGAWWTHGVPRGVGCTRRTLHTSG